MPSCGGIQRGDSPLIFVGGNPRKVVWTLGLFISKVSRRIAPLYGMAYRFISEGI